MRSIILHIHEDDCLEARFQAALDLGRQFNGHLTCLQAIPFEFGVPVDFYGTLAAQMAVEFHEQAGRVRAELEARLAKDDVPFDWQVSEGSATRLIAGNAPLSDIIVVGARNPSGSKDKPSSLITDLIGTLRAPVMVVPPSLKSFQFGAAAAIAWNGSAEAAHALVGSMPLLQAASQVHILIVREPKEGGLYSLPSLSAAAYLARHGIEAEIVDIPHEDGDRTSIAEKLMDAAIIRKAGFLTMGAYGHSRLRERLLGGVTRHMLMDPPLPLLLGH